MLSPEEQVKLYVKLILDSINPSGDRLTTFEVTMHRYIADEFLTHRTMCLSGDTMLWTRQPNGVSRKENIASLYKKWHEGAAPRPSARWVEKPLHLLEDRDYSMREVSGVLGMANPSHLRTWCRNGRIKGAYKNDPAGDWFASRDSLIESTARSQNTFSMQGRIKRMALDQIDQSSLDIGLTTITNVIYSGVKTVYEIQAGKHKIKTSKDHRFWTPEGWRTVAEFTPDQLVAVVQRGKPLEEHYADRFKQINGRWVSPWIRSIKGQLPEFCECGAEAVDAHHMVPVHADPTLAFEFSNIEHLCVACHKSRHVKQGWQKGNSTYVSFLPVRSIKEIGEEDTYDITVAGAEPNFIANGFVVHNSRNASSSRARPIKDVIQYVVDNPAMPYEFGKNKKGMQPGEEISPQDKEQAIKFWLEGRDAAVKTAVLLDSLGLHKQVVNRVLEPYSWHTMIFTATTFENFFTLRDHSNAQAEIRLPAARMQTLYNESTPTLLQPGEWHMPYLLDSERNLPLGRQIGISVGRCAKVSYLNQGQVNPDRDYDLAVRLSSDDPKHGSPFEHVAMPMGTHQYTSNFTGWAQARSIIESYALLDMV